MRQESAVQAFDQELDRPGTCPRKALGERVRAQQHRGSHDFVRIRLSYSAGVAPQQAKLKLGGELFGNRARDEPAEAGVDAVRVLSRPVRRPLDKRTGTGDFLAGEIP